MEALLVLIWGHGAISLHLECGGRLVQVLNRLKGLSLIPCLCFKLAPLILSILVLFISRQANPIDIDFLRWRIVNSCHHH